MSPVPLASQPNSSGDHIVLSQGATQLERAILELVVELHPDHLTVAELILKVADDQDHSEGGAVKEAITDLRSSGLLRYIDDTVAPTHAALCAVALLLS